MNQPEPDTRSDWRKLEDERIANEPPLPVPVTAADAKPLPLEQHLKKLQRRPLAVIGVVENGVVRPVDPQVHLPEHSHVIIVAAEASLLLPLLIFSI